MTLRLNRAAIAEAGKSAAAAISAAEAANKTAEIMEKTAEKQLRAYVMVDSATLGSIYADNKVRAVVTIKNFGSTPARDVVHLARTTKAKFPLQKELVIDPSIGGPISRMTLAPGQPMESEVVTEERVTSAQFEALKKGELAIYVHGLVSYV